MKDCNEKQVAVQTCICMFGMAPPTVGYPNSQDESRSEVKSDLWE